MIRDAKTKNCLVILLEVDVTVSDVDKRDTLKVRSMIGGSAFTGSIWKYCVCTLASDANNVVDRLVCVLK